MFWTKRKASTRKVILSLAVLCLAAAGLIVGAQLNSTDASTALSTTNNSAASPSATFPGTGLGAIPDSPGGTPPVYGTPLVISYAVTGIAGTLSDVGVNMTVTHSWVGDLDVVLRSPGGTASQTIYSRVGALTATSFGSSSDLAGLYNFTDSAAGANFWTAAAATPVPAGNYRTTAPGPVVTSPAPVTSLTTPFAGLTPAQINGTWTLTIRDGGGGDTGSVTASSLTLNSAAVAVTDAPVDFTGDGRSDYVVVRNTGVGTSGQVTWFYLPSSGGGTQGFQWGLASDFFVAEDFDGDLKDDITVWRPGAATQAAFYVLNSNGFTARVEAFGQTGDDPTVVGDYNNDGKADLAVYRSGAASGDPSFWYYRTVANGPVSVVQWGQNGDFPAPGDYDGNGNSDFCIQRNAGGGQAAFWLALNGPGTVSVTFFGTPTDTVVPGDYDDDGKTDIATARGSGGAILWSYDPSGTAGVQVVTNFFGVAATDFATQGDYDGDGRTDLAIWRPSATAGQSAFWIYNLQTSSALAVPFGQNGDYPVANFNSH